MQALSEGNASAEPPEFGDQTDLYFFNYRDVGPFLQRHYKMIAAAVVAAVAVVFVYLLVAEPVFTAQAEVLIDPGLPNVLRDQSIEPQSPMDSPQVETEIAVLRSDEVAAAVVERFKLGDDPEFRVQSGFDYLPAWAISRTKLASLELDKSRLVLAKFRKNLSVRRIGVSYAIDIFFSSRDPDQAARIANGVAEAYMRFQLDMRANAARLGSQWLEQRLSALRHEMNDAARLMQKYRAGQDYSISRKIESVSPSPNKPAATPLSADGSQPAKVETAPEEPLTFEDLESKANTYRRIYENYLQSYMAAVQQQSFPISNAHIITKATRPLTQSRPTGLILVMGVIVGALAGVGLGILRDRSNGGDSWSNWLMKTWPIIRERTKARAGNGIEFASLAGRFTSLASRMWRQATRLIRPRSSASSRQDAFVESPTGRPGAERINETLFSSPAQARAISRGSAAGSIPERPKRLAREETRN